MIGVAAACSVGGGGSAPAPTTISGGSTTNSSGKGTLAVKLHIPAASASTSSQSRATAASTRSGRVRPNLISTASNGLSIQGHSTTGGPPGPEFDFDISSNNTQSCSSDGAGGRTCSITITETAGSYTFTVATYASAPTANGPLLSTLPALDSGNTATYMLSPGTTATIAVTLGGNVAKISLDVPPSVDGYLTSATLPIGVVAYDSAGDVIISSVAYSTPITISTGTNNTSVVLSTLTVTPQSGNGAPSSGGTVTSNFPSDVITLNYAYVATASGAPPVGATVSVTATGASASTASGTLSPLFITDTQTSGGPTATTPPVFAINYATASITDTITISEAGSSVSAFSITSDPLNGCGQTSSTAASTSNPFLFQYNGGTAVTIPPASVAATSGTGTFTVETTNYGTTSACVYDVADTSGTVIPVSFSTSYSSIGSGQYTANVPGGLLYLTAVQGTYIAPNAVASPGYIGSLVGSAVLMYAPSAPTTAYQINDTALTEPLGIAHDLAGDVFVADYAAHVVNEYTPSEIAAYPAPPVSPYMSYTYTYPSPVSTPLVGPNGLAFNAKTSTLYVSDTTTGYITELSAGQLLPPGETPQSRRGGMASERNIATRPVSAAVRNPAARVHTLSTNAMVTAYFNVGGSPAGIAFDSADDLFVSFPNTGTVSEYAPVDGDTGGGTFNLTPIANFTGTSIPSAIAIASGGTHSGDLYVFDAGGTGILDFFSPSNIAAPTSSGFGYSPAASAFAIDSSGNVYTTSNPPGSQTTSASQVNVIENGGAAVPLGPTFTPNPTNPSARTLYIPYATF